MFSDSQNPLAWVGGRKLEMAPPDLEIWRKVDVAFPHPPWQIQPQFQRSCLDVRALYTMTCRHSKHLIATLSTFCVYNSKRFDIVISRARGDCFHDRHQLPSLAPGSPGRHSVNNVTRCARPARSLHPLCSVSVMAGMVSQAARAGSPTPCSWWGATVPPWVRATTYTRSSVDLLVHAILFLRASLQLVLWGNCDISLSKLLRGRRVSYTWLRCVLVSYPDHSLYVLGLVGLSLLRRPGGPAHSSRLSDLRYLDHPSC